MKTANHPMKILRNVLIWSFSIGGLFLIFFSWEFWPETEKFKEFLYEAPPTRIFIGIFFFFCAAIICGWRLCLADLKRKIVKHLPDAPMYKKKITAFRGTFAVVTKNARNYRTYIVHNSLKEVPYGEEGGEWGIEKDLIGSKFPKEESEAEAPPDAE